MRKGSSGLYQAEPARSRCPDVLMENRPVLMPFKQVNTLAPDCQSVLSCTRAVTLPLTRVVLVSVPFAVTLQCCPHVVQVTASASEKAGADYIQATCMNLWFHSKHLVPSINILSIPAWTGRFLWPRVPSGLLLPSLESSVVLHLSSIWFHVDRAGTAEGDRANVGFSWLLQRFPSPQWLRPCNISTNSSVLTSTSHAFTEY
jgi:hypothetical protein